MRKQFAVLGLGRFGSSLAVTLTKMGHEVLAVDIKEEAVEAIVREVTKAVQADVHSEEALKSLGLKNFDTVVVAIGQDVQTSILATVMLKEMGVKHLVAKAQSELHGKVLEKVGADTVIFPERDMGIRVAHCLVSCQILDQIQLSPDYSIAEINAMPKMAGKTLGQLNLRVKMGLNVLVIKRDKELIIAPGAETMISGQDVLVVLGSNKAIDNLGNYF
jgi:trk system potassium uptake protein TrkA